MRTRRPHIPDYSISANDLAESMEDWARHICGRRAIPPEAAIDALELAKEVKGNQSPPQDMIARLRAAAIRHRPQGHMMIVAQMELIADRLEHERRI
ncbi:MAG: hypothetical protein IAE63_04165 [Alphaproteobacteria bacterium]|nr:hypothetical protein [Alphaproteobacteria bacterium]